MTTTNTTIVVDSKTAEDLARILKTPIANGTTLTIKVRKEWSEMTETERYDQILATVKNLGTLERAKGEFRGYGVSHCRSFEEVAAVVYAAGRKYDEEKRSGFNKDDINLIEWRADGRIFVNGREGFLTSSRNPAIMLADK